MFEHLKKKLGLEPEPTPTPEPEVPHNISEYYPPDAKPKGMATIVTDESPMDSFPPEPNDATL